MNDMFDDELGMFGGVFDSDEFEGDAMRAAAEDMGDEFTPLGKSKFDKNLNPEELKADLERQNLNLPSDEEEMSYTQNMMDKRNAHERMFGAGSLNESMLNVQDSDGNVIKRHALVVPVNGVDKKGRVMGFADDGNGTLQIIVSWEWPIDMKYTNPKEMVKEKIYPEDVRIASLNEEELPHSDHPDGYTFNRENIQSWFADALWQLRFYDNNTATKIMTKAFNRDFEYKPKMSEVIDNSLESEGPDFDSIEEIRGLGSSVKNTGDRNVKQREDHGHAPITNLNESIKKLFEGKVTKKQLREFISEQAREIAKKLKD